MIHIHDHIHERLHFQVAKLVGLFTVGLTSWTRLHDKPQNYITEVFSEIHRPPLLLYRPDTEATQRS